MKLTLMSSYQYQRSYDFISRRCERFAGLQGYRNNIFPLAGSYFSPINPMFAIGINDTRLFSDMKVVAFRDGFLGLCAFFCRFPVPPKNFSTKIGIPFLLAKVVPVFWKKHCFYYDFQLRKIKKPQKMLIFKFPEDDFSFNEASHIQKINSLVASKNIEEVHEVTLLNNHLFSGPGQSSGPHITNFRSFLFSSSISRAQLYFCLEPFSIYDHFLLHAGLFQDAYVEDLSYLESVDEVINLSPYHQVRVSFEAPSDLGKAFPVCYKVWQIHRDGFFQNPFELKHYRDIFRRFFIV
jgi:hypothetical protein